MSLPDNLTPQLTPSKDNPPSTLSPSLPTPSQPPSVKESKESKEEVVLKSQPSLSTGELQTKMEAMERVMELMYWVKAKEITTPESRDMSTKLDQIFKFKTLRIETLINSHGAGNKN